MLSCPALPPNVGRATSFLGSACLSLCRWHPQMIPARGTVPPPGTSELCRSRAQCPQLSHMPGSFSISRVRTGSPGGRTCPVSGCMPTIICGQCMEPAASRSVCQLSSTLPALLVCEVISVWRWGCGMQDLQTFPPKIASLRLFLGPDWVTMGGLKVAVQTMGRGAGHLVSGASALLLMMSWGSRGTEMCYMLEAAVP